MAQIKCYYRLTRVHLVASLCKPHAGATSFPCISHNIDNNVSLHASWVEKSMDLVMVSSSFRLAMACLRSWIYHLRFQNYDRDSNSFRQDIWQAMIPCYIYSRILDTHGLYYKHFPSFAMDLIRTGFWS